MGYLENICIRGNLSDSEIVSKFGAKIAEQHVKLTVEESEVLKLYIRGYYLIQRAGEFIDYKKLPFWKYLKVLPPIPSVVGAAFTSERIGKEILDETLDYEYILKVGGKLARKNMRNLGNLLSGVMSQVGDEKITDKTFLRIKQDMRTIINSWSNRTENKI